MMAGTDHVETEVSMARSAAKLDMSKLGCYLGSNELVIRMKLFVAYSMIVSEVRSCLECLTARSTMKASSSHASRGQGSQMRTTTY